LDFIPKQYEEIPEFNEAFLIATRYKWNKEDMRVYDWVAMKERDEENALRKARDMALAKGMAEGMAEGIEQGREEGEKNKAIEIAKNLLDILDDETIALKTGLTPTDVKKLRN
ncbi:MAG: hypothetical protein NTY39_05420, partial [Campylobacterales bacterium]|nr:hypothetical protein [Campylobacterales bacterium]